jgi:chemotaxis response regulator CheB
MMKILIVDDSAFARNRLRMIFESGGHEIHGCAENGEQALEMFKAFTLSL